VKTVAAMTTNVFPTPAGTTSEPTVLRVAGAPDVIIDRDGRPSVAGPNGIDADMSRIIECTPAERTLRLWGRHPASTHGQGTRRRPSITLGRPAALLPSELGLAAASRLR